MQLSQDGLSLWYGTADAPAPPPAYADRSPATLTIGVRPASPANVVSVRFRVDGGRVQALPGVELRVDPRTGSQYFLARFPPLAPGQTVEYGATFTCSGRTVPAVGTGERHWSSFQLTPTGVAAPGDDGMQPSREVAWASAFSPPVPAGRFPFALDYVGRLRAQLDKPEVIGEMPEGLRVNYYVLEGDVRGPRLNARVRTRGCDNMLVRRDGVGEVSVHCALETAEGAMIGAHFGGAVDFGAAGYARALGNRLPPRPAVNIAIRLGAAHPMYLWMNRLQFLGVGRIFTARLLVEYDLFAVQQAVSPGTSGCTPGERLAS